MESQLSRRGVWAKLGERASGRKSLLQEVLIPQGCWGWDRSFKRLIIIGGQKGKAASESPSLIVLAPSLGLALPFFRSQGPSLREGRSWGSAEGPGSSKHWSADQIPQEAPSKDAGQQRPGWNASGNVPWKAGAFPSESF